MSQHREGAAQEGAISFSERRPGGRVVWITGLSGAGKTTLARALLERLPGAVLLDGDELREALGTANAGFDADSRKKLALTYARLAGLLARQGMTVVVATISCFYEVHAWNRENLPGYLEVFLDVPEELRRRRDPKGLYAAEKAGGTAGMAGSRLPVEVPRNPHIRLDETVSIPAAVRRILAALSPSS